MSIEKKRKLELTVAALQKQWGRRAIRRLGQNQESPIPHVPTGFPALDKALAVGGLPRGRISEIIGVPTSGTATVALKVVSQAQAEAGRPASTAIYFDLEQSFDPDYAARCGVELARLVLVRPYDARQGLAILQDFALGGGANVLVFDAPFRLLAEPRLAQALASTLDRIIAPLSRSECALLFLTSLPAGDAGRQPGRPPLLDGYPQGVTLPHYAAIRLLIQRERWLYRQRDIRGYQAQVLVVKNKLGPAGQQVSIAITFNGTVEGDGNPEGGS